MALPPFDAGAAHVTSPAPSAAVALTFCGAPGAFTPLAIVHPMSLKMASVAAPGAWIASPLLRIGVISALTVPGAYLSSSRCELLDPPSHGEGAYSLARPPSSATRFAPPK